MAAPQTGALPLKDQAYKRLLDLLMSGELTPDAFWSERGLAARLGMSKTPIRVALERLDHEGYVEILPQRGVRLRELTDVEAVDFFDLRIALETWVVRRVAGTAARTALRDLRRVVARQRTLRPCTADAVAAYFQIDCDFHMLLCELAGNDEIRRVVSSQNDKLWRAISTLLHRDPGWIRTTIAEHDAIVDALETGDPGAAERAIAMHLERGKDFLRQALLANAL